MLEKLKVIQLVKKFLTFCGTQRFDCCVHKSLPFLSVYLERLVGENEMSGAGKALGGDVKCTELC
jgi:hypothetical protein